MSASAPPNDSFMILQKYDINNKYAQILNRLKGFKVILICDDSTSMRETLSQGQTKWDELRRSAEIVIDICAAFKIDCDVLFLNRQGLRNVVHISQIEIQFSNPPAGCTPLTQCFEMAINCNKQELTERKLNVIIFTDGCPTSQSRDENGAIKEFKNALKSRHPIDKIFVSIVACTDDEYALEYLNNWDRTIPNLDVVDDYQSEKKEIYKKGRQNEAFTFGDYIVKIICGAVDKELDSKDESGGCEVL